MTDDKNRLLTLFRVDALAGAISELEGHAFGPDVVFRLDYGRIFAKEVRFTDIPEAELYVFVNALNEATKPVREAFAAKLRKDLVVACGDLAKDAEKVGTIRY